MDFAKAAQVKTKLRSRFKQLDKQRQSALDRVAKKTIQTVNELSKDFPEEVDILLREDTELKEMFSVLKSWDDNREEVAEEQGDVEEQSDDQDDAEDEDPQEVIDADME